VVAECIFLLVFVLPIKWSATAAVNSQVPEGQQSNVPTTVANGQPVSNAGVSSVQDRQMNGSRFNPEKNRELQKLPLLKGDGPCACTFMCCF